jgi:hypothetical protein
VRIETPDVATDRTDCIRGMGLGLFCRREASRAINVYYGAHAPYAADSCVVCQLGPDT